METFEFLGFGLYAWITIVTVLTMFSVLLFTKLRADLVFLGAIGVLYVQHHGGGPLRRHCQDVVEEVEYLTLEAADSVELCLGHGWCVYVDRYAAEPDYLGTLCRPYGLGDSQPEAGSGAPFVLVDNHNVVVEDGVVHGEVDTDEIT